MVPGHAYGIARIPPIVGLATDGPSSVPPTVTLKPEAVTEFKRQQLLAMQKLYTSKFGEGTVPAPDTMIGRGSDGGTGRDRGEFNGSTISFVRFMSATSGGRVGGDGQGLGAIPAGFVPDEAMVDEALAAAGMHADKQRPVVGVDGVARDPHAMEPGQEGWDDPSDPAAGKKRFKTKLCHHYVQYAGFCPRGRHCDFGAFDLRLPVSFAAGSGF